MIYRGNIVEVKQDSLVVMLDDCTFQYVKKYSGLEEGMEMYFEDRDIIKKSNLNLRSIALIAASIFLFIATTFYGVDLWNTSYKAVAIVSVDINPSVEIEINKNHNVIKAIALNEDAKDLPLNNLKSQPIDKALQELVNMARVEGYIKDTDENYILVTSVDLIEDRQEEKILKDLIAGGKEKIESSASEVGDKVQVIAIRSNQETLEEAKKENISVGKKEIAKNKGVKDIKELKELKDIKDVLDNKDIKDIKDIINNKDIKDTKKQLEKEKEKIDKHIKDIEKEANKVKDKLKELQQDKSNIKSKEEKNTPRGQIQKKSKEYKNKLKQELNKIQNNNGKGQNKNK